MGVERLSYVGGGGLSSSGYRRCGIARSIGKATWLVIYVQAVALGYGAALTSLLAFV